MPRRLRGSIEVSVDIDDVVSELSNQDIREEFEARFGAASCLSDFDLLEEIRAELAGGRPNYAFALVESALLARRIPDAAKQDAYEAAGRAH